jgi:primosomal protein N' (replication factor Y) (superfamily II helicase)
MFAEIAVHAPMARRLQAGDESGGDDAPLGVTFHYSVPAHLADVLRPGHLVWVPFGREELHGVVLVLVDEAPEGVRTRALIDLVLPEPVLTPAQLDLARWLSGRTLASILDCLLLMLPAGLAQKAEPVLTLTGEGRRVLGGDFTLTPGPSPSEREGSVEQMSFGAADFVEALHAGPYFVQLPGLKAEQHALLAYLLEHEQAPERVLARLEGDLSRRSVADPLIERGLVTRQRRIAEPPLKPKTGKQVALTANQETIEQRLPTLGRQSKQADVLAWLAAHGEPMPTVAAVCEAVGCTAAPVRSLAGRGWLRIETDKTVTLQLPAAAVRERLIELRGGEKYRRVLEALAGEVEPVWVGWLYAETGADLSTLRELAAANLITLGEAEVWRDPLAGKAFVADTPPALTEDQAQVWAEIEKGMREAASHISQIADHAPHSPLPTPLSYLLHGVTGSGKTEIYLRAIEATLAAGRQAIALVPEIALTPQTVRRFAARFGQRVTVYHSDLSPGERYDVWRKARAGQVQVVVGARSALFLPLPNIGLIVLDEEHDPSYKESQRAPRYHARDAALHLARLTGATLLLGSATPSLETFYAAQLGQIRLLELPRRIMGHAKAIAEQQKQLHLRQTVYRPVDALHQEARYAELPPVQVIDLRQELRAGNRSMFSRALQAAMERVLAAQQQAILFLNRRGTATFVICRDCGHVLNCEHCDVPLTYHEGAGSGVIVCHHCGRRAVQPEQCPECASRRIRYLGAGTEKIAEQVSALWPQARVVRWDRDATGRKGSHDAILSQFASRQADVMVGTQMIAKGLDLPLVTLVGVINADVGLYLPDFRAAERSFQLLTQVAGRAGRSLLGGQVIVQSYRPEHYAIQAARRHDYLDFSRQELSFRRELGYPPFRRLARLIFVHKERERAKAEAEALARGLRFAMDERGASGVDLIGPAPCFFGREQGKYRWHIVLRAVDPAAFLRTFDIPAGWRVDVDPVSLL